MWQDHVKAGCFPDCDMLPIGMVGAGFNSERHSNFTMDEAKTMMTLWCMFRSPLMIGAELTKLSDEDLSLLTNKTLLTYMEDGYRAHQVARNDDHAIWVTENAATGKKAVAVFNLSDKAFDFADYKSDVFAAVSSDSFNGIDIWTKEEYKITADYSKAINPHSVLAIEIK